MTMYFGHVFSGVRCRIKDTKVSDDLSLDQVFLFVVLAKTIVSVSQRCKHFIEKLKQDVTTGISRVSQLRGRFKITQSINLKKF